MSTVEEKIFIAPDIDNADSLDAGSSLFDDIVAIFKARGYRIVHDDLNHDAPGLMVHRKFTLQSLSERYNATLREAENLGARIPNLLSLEEILFIDQPVIAKRIDLQGGVGKYLLQNYEDKIRFMTWSFCWKELLMLDRSNPFHFEATYNQTVRDSRQLLENYLQGCSLDPGETERINEWKEIMLKYSFQTFIESPDGINRSYRVVADWTGKVHYIALLENAQREVEHSEIRGSNVLDSLQKSLRIIPDPDILLFQKEDNPLYIPNIKATSNKAQGGKVNILYSRYLKEFSEEPNILKENSALFKLLVLQYRKYTPILGFDFIPSMNMDDLTFIEFNLPKIFKEAFPENIDNENLNKYLLEKSFEVEES